MKPRNLKLLTASTVAATSILASAAAFAAYPTIEEPVVVDHSGFYVGGSIGWGAQDLESGRAVEPTLFESDGSTVANPATAGNRVRISDSSDDGLAGRLFIGYNVNQYFAVELGGAAWSEADYKGHILNPAGGPNPPGDVILGRAKGDQRTYDIDLLAKVTYPFDNGFKVYAKGGAAYVWSNTDLSGNSLATFAPIVRRRGDDSDSGIHPEAAVGVGYNVDDNWSVNVEYAYIWGNNDNPLKGGTTPDLQLATVGVQYDVT